MGERLALIIGNSVYQDQTLARLESPDVDVGALRDVLKSSQVGGFDEVDLIFNSTFSNVRMAISAFFSRKSLDDLLVLYFSGHGVLDQNGRLYLAVKDTNHSFLRATAIPAGFIAEEMDNSRSRRQVLILDCCHSGAFARGAKGSPGSTVGTASAFGGAGYGRVVLTASDATQYAWEGDHIIGEAQGSLFTHFLVRGLQTGEADYNKDGHITIDELYDFVYDQVLKHSPNQTPSKWSSKEQGNIVIAQTPSIDPYAQFSVHLQPQKLRAGQAVRLTVNNQGNIQKTFNLTLRDQGGNLDFSPQSSQLSVSGGQSSTAEFRARLRQRRIIGREESYPFTAVVSLLEGGTQIRSGEVAASALLPLWILSLVIALFLVGIVAAGYWINSRNQGFITGNAPTNVDATQQFLAARAISCCQAQTATQAAASITAHWAETSQVVAAETVSAQTADASQTAEAMTVGASQTAAIQSTEAMGRIVFVSARDGDGEIYVMNADGSEQTRLTNNSADDFNPAWSPDGTRIAFESARDGDGEIYVMNTDGSEQTRLTNNSADDWVPAWSPDGTRIAFASNRDGNWEIYLMDADGSEQTRLTNNSAVDFHPAWSSDGTHIVFESERDGNREIYVMNADGSKPIRLTNNSARDWSPAWSPDSERIVYESEREGNFEIYVMNADGAEQTRLTNNSARDNNPAWSPNGGRIAFNSYRDGNWEIYLINVDGLVLTRLTDNSEDDFHPAWEP